MRGGYLRSNTRAHEGRFSLNRAAHACSYGCDRISSTNALACAYDVVGPACESGDILAEGRDLAPLKPGDLLAIRDAGAYGAVMSSSYNSRPPDAEVMVRGDGFAVIRPRFSYEALLARDVLPDWLS